MQKLMLFAACFFFIAPQLALGCKSDKECIKMGLIFLRSADKDSQKNAHKFFIQGCKFGNTRACTFKALLNIAMGRKKHGIKQLQKFCDLKDAVACFRLWELVKKEDPDEAQHIYAKSIEAIHGLDNLDSTLNELEIECQRGDHASCTNMAILLEDLKMKDKAIPLYDKGCKGKVMEACSNLGFIYQEKQDWRKAIPLYKMACQNDIPEGCYNIACYYSLIKKLELSLKFLKYSIKLGFKDYKLISKDKDLKNLREFEEYRRFIASVKKSE